MSFSENIKYKHNYYPARLTKGKIWYISYYVRNPYTDQLERFRIKVNRIKSIKERNLYCKKVIIEINNKLYSGWNPYIDENSSKMFTYLNDAIETYKKAKYIELESNSIRSYESFLTRFLDWLNEKHPSLYSGHFQKNHATSFMLYVKSLPNVGASSYNNTLVYFRSVFNWLKKMDYVPENHFANIDKIKKVKPKVRRTLTIKELQTLIKWTNENNTQYLLICMLCYYCFLRPDDIVKLRIKDFDLKKHLIIINADRTKNDHDSFRVIPIALEPYLKCIDFNQNKENMLFSEIFKPGKKQIDSRKISKYWANHIRPNCGFGMDLQFYSLKDTGITNMMADGISPVYVQGQADHSSLSVTEKYTHTHTPEGFEQLRNKTRTL